jgi:hypothetical protein
MNHLIKSNAPSGKRFTAAAFYSCKGREGNGVIQTGGHIVLVLVLVVVLEFWSHWDSKEHENERLTTGLNHTSKGTGSQKIGAEE